MSRLKYIILLIVSALCATSKAQTLQEGQAMFSAGNYDGALPVMQKYLKMQPENASRNYWYGVCLYETGNKNECLKYLEKAAKKKIIKAYKYMGLYYADICDYPAAIDSYEKFVKGMKADRSLHDEAIEEQYLYKTDSLKRAYRLFRNTARICFIDSFVVNKDNLLQTYMLDESAGSIDSYSGFFGKDGNGDVFLPETGSDIYFTTQLADTGRYQLHRAYHSNGKWTDATSFRLGDGETDVRYPFVMSDGLTLYFASNGKESLGGYDIFVTRFNPETGTYLTPENIGMPFNSGANDYLYAIDEINNLGWFATDRNQPQDTVCVYVFIPNETRSTYNIETDSLPLMARASKIVSIAETQTDPDMVRSAKQSLTILAYSRLNEKKESDFLFVLDDLTDYHSADDFCSDEARAIFTEWKSMSAQLRSDKEKLQQQRDKWSDSNNRQREGMRQELLKLESEVEQLERKMLEAEIKARNTEIEFLSR